MAAAAAAAAGAAPECLSAQIRQVASDDVDMSAANQTASCGQKRHVRSRRPMPDASNLMMLWYQTCGPMYL